MDPGQSDAYISFRPIGVAMVETVMHRSRSSPAVLLPRESTSGDMVDRNNGFKKLVASAIVAPRPFAFQ